MMTAIDMPHGSQRLTFSASPARSVFRRAGRRTLGAASRKTAAPNSRIAGSAVPLRRGPFPRFPMGRSPSGVRGVARPAAGAGLAGTDPGWFRSRLSAEFREGNLGDVIFISFLCIPPTVSRKWSYNRSQSWRPSSLPDESVRSSFHEPSPFATRASIRTGFGAV